jgi:nucleoside-diphosphate-sugar epimerase
MKEGPVQKLQASKIEVVKSGFLFSVASIAMIVLNKACVSGFPHPSILLILQNSATLLILSFVGERRRSLESALIFQWLPCSLLFCVNLMSSLVSLVYISVPTFTVLRNLQPILAVWVDFIIRGEQTGSERIMFLVQILIGAILYCSHDLGFHLHGYLWALLHVVSMTMYSVVVKFKCEKLQLTALDMSWYNNALSIPSLFAVLTVEHIINSNANNLVLQDFWGCGSRAWCMISIIASLFVGFSLSVSGFQAQKVMSPTSWLALNNFSKIPAVAISVTLFGGYFSFAAAHGMAISILSAYLYALAGRSKISLRIKVVSFLFTATSALWPYMQIIREGTLCDRMPLCNKWTHKMNTWVSYAGTSNQRLTVLVLGSAGLVGSSLVSTLKREGYTVLEAPNRYSLDLRERGSLNKFDNASIDFCFFLACDVGGAKFLADSNYENVSFSNNNKIYDTVFPYLVRRKIPFIFSSSQLSSTHTLYGQVKRLGEVLTARSLIGKSIRFWNVYGPERITLKSHVISDWIFSCLKDGKLHSHTNGNELRDFTFVDDMAKAMVNMMRNFRNLPSVTDPVSGTFYDMKTVARIIQDEVGRPCSFVFSNVSARFPKSSEPSQIWPVETDLRSGVRRMISYYQKLVNESGSWKSRERVYLSVVMTNAGHESAFAFLQSFGPVAQQNNLDYEIIVVNTNPITKVNPKNSYSMQDVVQDLSFPGLRVPLTPAVVSSRIRFISSGVSEEFALFPQNFARNMGAQRSRGLFIMFVRPSMIISKSLVQWISKQTIDLKKAYYAESVSNIPSTFLHSYDCDGDTSSKSTNELMWTRNFSGLTIIPNIQLMDEGLLAKIPQLDDSEETFLRYLVDMMKIEWIQFEHGVCILSRSSSNSAFRQEHLQSKLLDKNKLGGQLWSETLTDNILDFAYNPEEPNTFRRHHSLFKSVQGKSWKGPFHPEFLIDFVGTKTKYSYDCDNWDSYRRHHLSRRIPCDQHDFFLNMGLDVLNISVYGSLPTVEEEYFEWLALMNAAVKKIHEKSDRPFVVVELGAWYGTWVARGARLMHTLDPGHRVHVVAVESDATGFDWMQEHLKLNLKRVDKRTLERGHVGSGSGTTASIVREKESKVDQIRILSLQEILPPYIVDIIHIDTQGHESFVLEKATLSVLNARVKFLHVGTHGAAVHHSLKTSFKNEGWVVLHEFRADSYDSGVGHIERTESGNIRFQYPLRITHAKTRELALYLLV